MLFAKYVYPNINIYTISDGIIRFGFNIDTVTNNKDVGSEFTIDYTPDIPDTGISAAQTVYFIGLIVLLSGVGIIYANVKPTEQK